MRELHYTRWLVLLFFTILALNIRIGWTGTVYEAGAAAKSGDVNGDGIVNFLDFGRVLHREKEVTFEAEASGGLEGVSPVSIAVKLTVVQEDTVTVNYAVTGGTATFGADYTLTGGTLIFAAGQTRKSITINIIDDGLDERDETIEITLSDPTVVKLGTYAQYTYSILDPRAGVGFDSNTSSAREDCGVVSISVGLSRAITETASVDYAVTGGTAVAGSDYVPAAGTLTFNPGQTSKLISISLINNGVQDGTKVIELTLSNAVNVKLGGIIEQILSVLDAESGQLKFKGGYPAYAHMGCHRNDIDDSGGLLDFSSCVIVVGGQLGPLEQKAITVLREEIQKRTGIMPETAHDWPAGNKPVVAVGLGSQAAQFAGPFLADVSGIVIGGDEGFGLISKSVPRQAVVIVGKDPRGVLYGVGRLLRKMRFAFETILVPDGLNIITSPRYPLRGHQLGYRPKTNAYDAWDPQTYDQYIRELGIFGVNAIEILPPHTDDDYMSDHMTLRPLEMMIQLSEIIDSYGMDVWIWYPNMADNLDDDDTIRDELEEREEIFSKLKRIDAVFIPGGDPGDADPDNFFPFMGQVAGVLRRYHPNAKMWASPQNKHPKHEWLDSFYRYINQKPDYLGGVVFGPLVKTTMSDMRTIVDPEIPIRRYPDITHSVACQYPVYDWDVAWAHTYHREAYNPRPADIKIIHNAFDEYAIGTISYSEGINDDVNKFVWSDQDWDPDTRVIETLRDFSRLFISPKFTEEIAQGILMQELDWRGPLATNEQIHRTLSHWQNLENNIPDVVRLNYRFEMALMRAYYDGYIKNRFTYETDLESQAMSELERASQIGYSQAVSNAESILRQTYGDPQNLRQRCFELADSLFMDIGSQTTVDRHGAKERSRGAFMDGIDAPLNHREWLFDEFDEMNDIDDVEALLNRTNPGPGGFYDDFGIPGWKDRVVNDIPWEVDPVTLISPYIAFCDYDDVDYAPGWKTSATTRYDTPLVISYDNLDPNASYKVKMTYAGRLAKYMRLVADDQYEIHGYRNVKDMRKPTDEYSIPQAATSDGNLKLTWTSGEEQRSIQVSEIWLIKQ